MYKYRLNAGEIVPTSMKRLCAFAISHSYALLRRIAPSRVACRSVCRSVSLSH